MKVALITRKRLEYASALLGMIALFCLRGMTDYSGVGYFILVIAVYEGFWILLGGQVTDICGRMVRSRLTKGQIADANTAWGAIVTQQILLGIFGSLALGFTVMKIAEQAPALSYLSVMGWLLMPAFFFRSISAALAGYCSGKGSEGPAGISALLRAVIFFFFAFLFLGILQGYGVKVGALLQNPDIAYMYGSLGLIIALDLAELLAMIFLLIVAAGASKSGFPEKNDYLRSRETAGGILMSFWSRRGVDLLNQILIYAASAFLLGFVFSSGSVTYPSRFTGILYLGYFGIFVACGLLTGILTKAMVAKTNAAFRKEEMRSARNLFQIQTHWAMIIGGFFMSYLASMSETLADLLGTGEQSMEQVLLIGSFPVLLFPLILVSMDLLIQNGNGLLTAAALFLSGVISCVFGRVFLFTGRDPYLSLVYALLIWCVCMAILLMILTIWKLNMTYDPVRSILTPIVTGAVLGLILLLLSRALSPHLGDQVTMIICFVISLVLYNIALLLMRNLSEKEVRSVPGGRFLEALGHLLRVL